MDSKKFALGLVKLVAVGGTIAGAVGTVAYLAQKALNKEIDMQNRYKSYYTVTNQWLNNKNNKKNVGKFFDDNEYKTIAIYGMGSMAELFYSELKETNPKVKVAYFIDKNAEDLYYGFDDIAVVGLDAVSSQESVDAIIVTPVYDFDKISDDLTNLEVDATVVSLEDVIYEI